MQTEGYSVKDYGQPVKRYCQFLSLKSDNELIRRYRQAHDKEHFWREIGEGIRQVGILDMQIFIHENHLVMIVEAPLDFDWDSAMARLATLPRQQEWENHVAQFQDCDAGATSDQKWHMMERMFHL